MNMTELAIIENVAKLDETQQEKVLHYVQQLTRNQPVSVMGETLVELIQRLGFDPKVVEEMAEAIETLCE